MSSEEPMIYLDEALRPNASLSPRAFVIVMTLVGIFSFAGGILYLTLGAWPVFGFFGLDMLAIWLAFKFSFRAQEQVTYIRIDSDYLRLWHQQRGKDDKTADLPTAFVRIELQVPTTLHTHLHIAYGNRVFVIGRFLTPAERTNTANRLRAALHRARIGAAI
ncbi:MAG: DUF2244 domain-containing protein [Hyphomonadaceae bacterium]